MVETIVSFGLVATLLMALVQYVKKQSGANGLLVLSGISIVGGLIYAMLIGFGYWELVVKHTLIVLTAANTMYSVLKQAWEVINPDDTNV